MAQLAQLRCAGLIANLEGFQNFKLPDDTAKKTSLNSLEERVRFLEKVMDVMPPPADTAPSWNGLATRLLTLRSIMLKGRPCVIMGESPMVPQDYKSMLANPSEITLQQVKTAVGDIKTMAPSDQWPQSDNDEEMLNIILQKLCHIVGWRKSFLSEIPVTPIDMYICALRLSHTVLNYGPAPLPMAIPMPPPGIRPKARKVCCDCCACGCHQGFTRSAVLGIRRSKKSSIDGKSHRFRWLRRILFWRKSGDASSVLSSGSSTVVD